MPCFLHVNIRWRFVVNFMPHPTVSPEECPQYPLPEPRGDLCDGEGRVLNFTVHTFSVKNEGSESKRAATVESYTSTFGNTSGTINSMILTLGSL